ncbi:hypothetical protein JTB14_005583 [Gonioctena quinquepunctata]|nr:hypothetical protein JTB14_005583 [Gonioctena quinquepunctata]
MMVQEKKRRKDQVKKIGFCKVTPPFVAKTAYEMAELREDENYIWLLHNSDPWTTVENKWDLLYDKRREQKYDGKKALPARGFNPLAPSSLVDQHFPLRREKGQEILGFFEMDQLDGFDVDSILNMIIGNVKSYVSFTLFNRANRNGRKIDAFSDLRKHLSDKKVKCVTHGWLSSGEGDMCRITKESYMHYADFNVIVMDWSPISGYGFYAIPMRATHEIANYYAELLNYLIDEIGINPQDIHLIGHSLGAHISGFAGRKVVNGKIGRITALDPALPGFNLKFVEGRRIRLTDAEFVDVIHTCGGYLGYKNPIGHIDIYPNGGVPPQPGCSILTIMEACSHARSWKLFQSSIYSKKDLMATKCSSLVSLEQKKCEGEAIPIGEKTPRHARGIYYMKTTAKAPFF